MNITIENLLSILDLSYINQIKLNGEPIGFPYLIKNKHLIITTTYITVKNVELNKDDIRYTVFKEDVDNNTLEIHTEIDLPKSAQYIEVTLNIETKGVK